MEADQVLGRAAAIISKYGHTQHVNARDASGKPVQPCEGIACARDMTGALLAGGKRAGGRAWVQALRALGEAIGLNGYEDVGDWRVEEAPARARDLCERMWEWEDRPGRTRVHVLDAFGRASRIVRGVDHEPSDQEAVEAARHHRSREPVG